MFSYFRKRILISGVAAEIKAQCKNQELVSQVCFTEAGMQNIVELGENRFEEKGKLRYFMISTFLLANTVCILGVSPSVKAACLELLQGRRIKIDHHMSGGYGPITLRQKDIDDLDETIDVGIQLFNSEYEGPIFE